MLVSKELRFSLKTVASLHCKHVGNAGNLARVPSVQVLVEGRGMVNHSVHKGNAARVPRLKVVVEGLDPMEHIYHPGDLTRVPGPRSSGLYMYVEPLYVLTTVLYVCVPETPSIFAMHSVGCEACCSVALMDLLLKGTT